MAKAKTTDSIITGETVIRKIHFIRGHKVMLDFDIAALYEVETKHLNEQVKRNIERFPEDFMLRLSAKEWQMMRSQIATASKSKRNASIPPFVITEHGITILASILKSDRAIKTSIAVVRAFIELKKMATGYDEIAQKLMMIEERLGEHNESTKFYYQWRFPCC